MEWIITVNVDAFDIEQAFNIGEILEYYQVAEFNINDIVYIVVNGDVIKPYAKYKCRVIETNISFEDEKFFSANVLKDNQILVSEYLTRLHLIEYIDDSDEKELTLYNLNIVHIPTRPIRNIGENKTVFKALIERFSLFHKTPNLVFEHNMELDIEEIFENNRLSYLAAFPKESWETTTLEEFLENRHLLINVFNAHFDPMKLLLLRNDGKDYFTLEGKVNDIDVFFNFVKTTMVKTLEDMSSTQIGLLKYFIQTSICYYMNFPVLYDDEIKFICNQLKIEYKNYNESMVEVVKTIIDLNPDTQYFSTLQLTKWIVNHFKIDRNEQVKEEITKVDRLISETDLKELFRLLKKEKNVIINNLVNYGGETHLKEILLEEGFLEFSSDKELLPFYNYVDLRNNINRYGESNIISKESPNLFTIIYSEKIRNEIDPFLYRKMLPYFVEMSPVLLIEESDFFRFTDYLIEYSSKDVFELCKYLNNEISKGSQNPFLISKDIVKNIVINNDQDLKDFLTYKIIPLISGNALEQDVKEKCTKSVNAFLVDKKLKQNN